MPWYDARVSVTHTYTITTTHSVTIEAPDFRAAQKKAAAQAVHASPDSETYLADCDHVESSLDDVVSIAEVDFQESSPEARFFEDQWRVYLLEPQGISDGTLVLWSEEAQRIGKARRADDDRETLQTPENILALVEAYENGSQLPKHPGWFFRKYLDVVRQMGCVLLGEEAEAPGLIVRTKSRDCVGALLPMKGPIEDSDLRAPDLPTDWHEG